MPTEDEDAKFALLGRAILEEAVQGHWWHSARVRVCRGPRMQLSTIKRVIQTARDLGLPDMVQDQEAAEAFIAAQDAAEAARARWLQERKNK